MENKIYCNICLHEAHLDENKSNHVCIHCGNKIKIKNNNNNFDSFIFSLTALILYIPANLFPFMSLELYGNKTETTIWEGIVSLSEGGNFILGAIIFLASMLIPFIKLISLFYLSLSNNNSNKNFKLKLYSFIKIIGPWAMLDIFLLGILIAVLKFDSLANVSAGEGSYMFLFVVIFTMIATEKFNPQLIWRNKDDHI